MDTHLSAKHRLCDRGVATNVEYGGHCAPDVDSDKNRARDEHREERSLKDRRLLKVGEQKEECDQLSKHCPDGQDC